MHGKSTSDLDHNYIFLPLGQQRSSIYFPGEHENILIQHSRLFSTTTWKNPIFALKVIINWEAELLRSEDMLVKLADHVSLDFLLSGFLKQLNISKTRSDLRWVLETRSSIVL